MAQQLRQLLAADMWPIAMFEIPKKRIDRFNDQARPAYKRLVEGLLLYDKVVIPTQDFLALTSLVSVLGERSVIDLFDAGAVRFVRFKGTLAYVGNGGGIKFCEMFNDENRRTPQPFCAPLEDAVDFALSGLAEKPKDRTLANLIVDATTEVNLQSVERGDPSRNVHGCPEQRSLAKYIRRAEFQHGSFGGHHTESGPHIWRCPLERPLARR